MTDRNGPTKQRTGWLIGKLHYQKLLVLQFAIHCAPFRPILTTYVIFLQRLKWKLINDVISVTK